MNEKQPIPLRLLGAWVGSYLSAPLRTQGPAGRTATKLKASYCTRFGGVHVLSNL